jgi:DNA-binding GntR family transcriptional regulator
VTNKASNLRAAAYERIRTAIIEGNLVHGSALSEYELATILNISRTPIREALRQLEREGLVRSIANKGSFVMELSIRDIHEIYQVREQLEGFAARVCAERMDTAEALDLERKLVEAQRQQDPESAAESDIRLHKSLIAVTNNRRVEQILSTFDDQVYLSRNQALRTPGRREAMIGEHLDIIRCILARDAVGAENAMRGHLRAARDNAIIAAVPANDAWTSDGSRR